MIKIVLLSVVSLAAASPITIAEYGGNYFMPFYRHFQQLQQMQPIERSDSYPVATESGGYGSAYGSGGYGSGGYGSGGYGSELSEGEQHDVSSDNSAGSSSGFDGGHQDYSSFTDFGKLHGGDEGSHGGGYIDHGDNYVHSVPVSEHVEVTKPVAVPVYKDIGIPVPQPVKINVPHPVAVGVPQPYPVAVPVSKPVPIQIVKTIAVPVERKVPYPVEKHIPVPVEKAVPITIEKHIPVPVFKPYPIKIPIYKTIYHYAKGHSH